MKRPTPEQLPPRPVDDPEPYTEAWALEAPGSYRYCDGCGAITSTDEPCSIWLDVDDDEPARQCGANTGRVIA